MYKRQQDILICTKNQLVADFLFDLRVLLQLAEMLDENSFRRAGVLNTLAPVSYTHLDQLSRSERDHHGRAGRARFQRGCQGH